MTELPTASRIPPHLVAAVGSVSTSIGQQEQIAKVEPTRLQTLCYISKLFSVSFVKSLLNFVVLNYSCCVFVCLISFLYRVFSVSKS